MLDPWQQWVLEDALTERPDGSWAAFECCLICPRQNGKNSILEALELAALFLFGEQLVIHSAHLFDTAREHFARMQALIGSCPDLDRKVAAVSTAHGKESIRLRSGARLKFIARSRSAARGFSGDRIVLDEAFDLSSEAVGAMLPTLSARPNPQVWYTSSAPHQDSAVLHGIRRRAAAPDSGRLWFAEWGCEPGIDPDDTDNWYTANPALGIRISEEFVRSEREAQRGLGDMFERERCGVPSSEDSGQSVFGPGRWQALADPETTFAGTPAIALEVAPDMSWASFGGAGRRPDGLVSVHLIDRRPGTGWVVDAARALTERWRVPIHVDPRSPSAGLVPDLEAAGVTVQPLPGGELSKACASLQHAVVEGQLRHPDLRPLNDAVHTAAVRRTGDSWVWARARSDFDISGLVAVTIAHWSLLQRPPPTSGFFSLSEVDS
jgi:phage terminase large subunit-like protein